MKGSFTIETSLLIPLLVGIYLIVINGGMKEYISIRDEKSCDKVQTVWEVKDFYFKSRIKTELSTEGEADDK